MTIARRVIAALCVIALLAALAPMVIVAFDNHMFYDDLGYAVVSHDAWRQTGSVAETVRTGWRHALTVRQTWQGAYTTNFLSTIQPGVFSESAYGWTTVFLLACFLLGMGFAVWSFCRVLLDAAPSAALSVTCLALLIATQFLPSAAEAFYWFNGGVNYTFGASMTYLALGFALRLFYARTKPRAALLTVAALAFLTLAGGCSYPCGLFAACVFAAAALCAFLARNRWKWLFLGLTVWLAACFCFNCVAPGNAVRSETLQSIGVVKAVAEAFYFGVALLGDFFSLPVLALCLLAALLLSARLRGCRCSFRKPWLVTLLAFCLFCAQLAPTLYTGNYLGDGRARDVYWYAYVALSLLLTLYWAGWYVKRPGARTVSPRLRLTPILLVAALLAVGCVAYHPEGAASYGPQNMAGGSALRSLMNGQAARFDAAMDAREATLKDPTTTDVALAPIRDVPAVFMSDALLSPQAEYMRNLYAEYYHKNSVTIAETE